MLLARSRAELPGPETQRGSVGRAGGVAAITLGLGLLTAVGLVIATSNPSAVIWTHAAAALILAQSILFAGVALRTMSSVEGNRELLRRFLRSQSGSVPHPVREQVRLMPPPPRLVAIGANPIHRPPPIPRRVIVAKGHIGNRPFLKYSDASVEIDTLLGRRCFITIDAAEEFVGGTAVMDAAEPADVALSA